MLKRLFAVLIIIFMAVFILLGYLLISGKVKITFSTSHESKAEALQGITKRRCSLVYLKETGAEKEEARLVWGDNSPHQNIQVLLNAWCDGALRDGLVTQKMAVESVAYDKESGELILSFTSSLCDRLASLREKFLLIESLLETLRYTGIPVRRVMFLIHQQPFSDRDLDFSCFWPIEGFIEKRELHGTN